MSDLNQSDPEEREASRRRLYRIGAPEIYAVWPLVVFAILLIGLVYGINIYESLFQLPQLAPVK